MNFNSLVKYHFICRKFYIFNWNFWCKQPIIYEGKTWEWWGVPKLSGTTVCTNLPFRTHQCIALDKASALSFEKYLKFTSVKLYFLIQNYHTPALISALLPRHSADRRITRSVVNLENPVPKFKNNYGQQSFFYIGAKNWNEIPTDLRRRNTLSVASFKNHYKNFLLGGQVCSH